MPYRQRSFAPLYAGGSFGPMPQTDVEWEENLLFDDPITGHDHPAVPQTPL